MMWNDKIIIIDSRLVARDPKRDGNEQEKDTEIDSMVIIFYTMTVLFVRYMN